MAVMVISHEVCREMGNGWSRPAGFYSKSVSHRGLSDRRSTSYKDCIQVPDGDEKYKPSCSSTSASRRFLWLFCFCRRFYTFAKVKTVQDCLILSVLGRFLNGPYANNLFLYTASHVAHVIFCAMPQLSTRDITADHKTFCCDPSIQWTESFLPPLLQLGTTSKDHTTWTASVWFFLQSTKPQNFRNQVLCVCLNSIHQGRWHQYRMDLEGSPNWHYKPQTDWGSGKKMSLMTLTTIPVRWPP
jgi:hypothetical protein